MAREDSVEEARRVVDAAVGLGSGLPSMLAEKLSGHLPQEIVVRGSQGCLLFPPAQR